MRSGFQVSKAVVLSTGALIATLTVIGCGTATSAHPSAATSSTAPTRTTGLSACATTDLTAKLGPKVPVSVDPQAQLGAAGVHYRIDLMWTNNSTSTCTMRGFADVIIDGPAIANLGSSYPLPDNGDTPATVALAPGATAHNVIRYIDSTGVYPDNDRLWKPTLLAAAPPNRTARLGVPWTAGTPVYFDPEDGIAAASISPITAGR